MNIEELKNIIKVNNEKILELDSLFKKHFNKDAKVICYNAESIYDEFKLKEIIKNQNKEIKGLDIMFNLETHKYENELNKKREELEKKELDKKFSYFYGNGLITINGIDISVDKFFMKELENTSGEIIYKFICTDTRIDKNFFGSFDDNNYKINRVYRIKNSKIFYDMYLDKNIYIDGKIIINTKEQLIKFIEYIKKWNKEQHEIVTEP